MTERVLALDVPADTAFIRLARMLVAGFAAECHLLDDAELAALRLAVSEVIGHLLVAAATQRRLRVDAVVDDGALEVRITDPSPAAPPGDDHSGLVVASALVDELSVDEHPDHQVVRLRFHDRRPNGGAD